MDIPNRVIEELTLISTVAGNQSDWMFIKRQLLLSLPSHMRKLFSTRDAKTKKQALNMFELQLIELYEEMTGIRLELINE
tara:strand:- start:368 stop:607 length:240 start_codon:yes stop_codon:yes gene_type:complete